MAAKSSAQLKEVTAEESPVADYQFANDIHVQTTIEEGKYGPFYETKVYRQFTFQPDKTRPPETRNSNAYGGERQWNTLVELVNKADAFRKNNPLTKPKK